MASKKIILDGKEITLYYQDIDFSTNNKAVYNKDFNLSGITNVSHITQMIVGDVWNEDDALQSTVFKDDGLMGIIETPKYEINVEINRGGTSVNEKHFKLSECNTYEDLANYGNNYFGL